VYGTDWTKWKFLTVITVFCAVENGFGSQRLLLPLLLPILLFFSFTCWPPALLEYQK
jgi:hypothetical protein